jgi:hypothetical protein
MLHGCLNGLHDVLQAQKKKHGSSHRRRVLWSVFFWDYAIAFRYLSDTLNLALSEECN